MQDRKPSYLDSLNKTSKNFLLYVSADKNKATIVLTLQEIYRATLSWRNLYNQWFVLSSDRLREMHQIVDAMSNLQKQIKEAGNHHRELSNRLWLNGLFKFLNKNECDDESLPTAMFIRAIIKKLNMYDVSVKFPLTLMPRFIELFEIKVNKQIKLYTDLERFKQEREDERNRAHQSGPDGIEQPKKFGFSNNELAQVIDKLDSMLKNRTSPNPAPKPVKKSYEPPQARKKVTIHPELKSKLEAMVGAQSNTIRAIKPATPAKEPQSPAQVGEVQTPSVVEQAQDATLTQTSEPSQNQSTTQEQPVTELPQQLINQQDEATVEAKAVVPPPPPPLPPLGVIKKKAAQEMPVAELSPQQINLQDEAADEAKVAVAPPPPPPPPALPAPAVIKKKAAPSTAELLVALRGSEFFKKRKAASEPSSPTSTEPSTPTPTEPSTPTPTTPR